ncbi:hypothetical protein HPP92_006080 [Vanilla planifolia]|uniref:Uncharacterized protein n=1 Tax=Vanilla planifolia TaxID=51239 RepID=A0A835VBJ7_VANPL|nr:hypothetical protein HPP92_006080 [Vanilla planifolia]
MRLAVRFGRVGRGADRLRCARRGAASDLVRHGRVPSKSPERRPPSLPPPVPFMRETTQKISSVLRDLPWDSARGRAPPLPVRWDSFTVNRVLKMHPDGKSLALLQLGSRLPGFKRPVHLHHHARYLRRGGSSRLHAPGAQGHGGKGP